MDWQTFRTHVNATRYCSAYSGPKTIASVLGTLADVQTVPLGPHPWYPLGVPHGGVVNGHTYVDQDHSYVGTDNILVAEASSCVILVMYDPQGRSRFACHLSAATSQLGMMGAITADLNTFFQSVNNDVGRPNVVIFSQDTCRFGAPNYEIGELMILLSSVFSDISLEWLALSTYVIEGESGHTWNPYCAVRVGAYGHPPRLRVTMTH